jgi:hypothetical protein
MSLELSSNRVEILNVCNHYKLFGIIAVVLLLFLLGLINSRWLKQWGHTLCSTGDRPGQDFLTDLVLNIQEYGTNVLYREMISAFTVVAPTPRTLAVHSFLLPTISS